MRIDPGGQLFEFKPVIAVRAPTVTFAAFWDVV
jgi:hypothetical protein